MMFPQVALLPCGCLEFTMVSNISNEDKIFFCENWFLSLIQETDYPIVSVLKQVHSATNYS